MSYIEQSYTKLTEVNSQLQMKCKEIDKLQEGKEMLVQDSSQLEAINKRLEAHNEKLIQVQKVNNCVANLYLFL